jgi:PleD family two-component response regulator
MFVRLEGMACGDRRHGKEPATLEEDNFPEGLRVLAVDDDRVSLRVLEAVLRQCKYKRERSRSASSSPFALTH